MRYVLHIEIYKKYVRKTVSRSLTFVCFYHIPVAAGLNFFLCKMPRNTSRVQIQLPNCITFPAALRCTLALKA